jgi:hypothetical protein
LLLQSASFFAPLTFVQWQENGHLEAMIEDMNMAIMDIDLLFRDWRYIQLCLVAKVLLCHVWSLVTSVANVFFVQWYLGGQFLWYGVTAMSYLVQRDGDSPFDLIFPKVTKCTLSTYGPSGSVQSHDALCVMPVNVLNDKIYLVAWFVLLGVSVLIVAFHVAAAVVLLSRSLRTKLLLLYLDPRQKEQRSRVSRFVNAANLADHLLLFLLAHNLGRMAFRRLVDSLYAKDWTLEEDYFANAPAESDGLVANQNSEKGKLSHQSV